MEIGKIKQISITEAMKRSYLDYAMSVIVARALPDVRDGLKPVHRRILYAAHQMNLSSAGRYTKSAKVVGEVLGKYHPHGDMPVYDALVRLAQDFSMRYPLIDGQGNFGSLDGDPPAAMRYTEVKLTPLAEEMLRDIEKKTVPFVPNFDNTLQEPSYLPAKVPNLLLMGSDGIAVGMATKIPPHNLSEVVDALVYMIKKSSFTSFPATENQQAETIDLLDPKMAEYSANLNFDVSIDDIMQFIKGPDFPTAGEIYDWQEIKKAYATGRGSIVMKAKAEIEDIGQGKSAIVITELPYQVNKARLVASIAKLVRDKKLAGISDLRDESDRHGVRIVVELKRDSRPRAVLNNLYKHTNLMTTFPVNMVALVNGSPQTLTLKLILQEYLKHRFEIVTHRSQYELKKARHRAHILEGLKIAVDHIDEVIETIKKSRDSQHAAKQLMEKFSLTEIQANAILDMQLKRLSALEREKIEDEYQMIKETIEYLEALLSNPSKILQVIKSELLKLKEKYGDKRKTRVYKSKVQDFTEEQLIPDEETLITITKTGYIKRLSQNTFKRQKRGGKGVTGMTMKEKDSVDQLIAARTHDYILFFTDKGKVYQKRVWQLPKGTRQSKGQAVVNLINIERDENVTSTLPVKKDAFKENGYIFMTTKQGIVKKTPLSQFKNIRQSGIIIIKLDEGDFLCWAKLTNGSNQILLVSHQGKAIRFDEQDVRPMGRNAHGVRGITLGKDDFIKGMAVIDKDKTDEYFLTISEKGRGKRTKFSYFPKQKRGGKGVKAARLTEKTGKIAVAQKITADCQDLIISTVKGQTVKVPLASVKALGRTTSGVYLIRVKENDMVAAATCV